MEPVGRIDTANQTDVVHGFIDVDSAVARLQWLVELCLGSSASKKECKEEYGD